MDTVNLKIEIEGEIIAEISRLKNAIRNLKSEVNCRIQHGAESGGHLEYVEKQLESIIGEME